MKINNFKFEEVVIGKEGLLKGPFGSDLKKSLFVPQGENTYKVYLQENILQSNLKNGEYYISKAYYESNMKRYTVKENDFIVTCDGTLGEILQFKNIKEPGIISSSLLRITLDPSIIDADYFYYYFKIRMKNALIKQGNNSVLKHLPGLKVLKEFNLELPSSTSEQKQLALILKLLDSKIELNNRINFELEAMAKTLYDYWFVQFDFPDKNGMPYKSCGGKMVWNDELKREIPEGWKVKTLLDIATFVNGLACQKFRPKENEDSYRVIKIREMGTGFTENSEFVSKNIPEKVVVFNGDILFSWSATLDVKIWTGGTGALNQHIFKITSEKYPKSFYYFELLNYLQHFKMMAELRKTTMGHITQDHLRESRITIPPIEIINELDKIIKPILEKKVKLEIEKQKLTELRDWLLPMLMNGQVKVKDEKESLSMATEPGVKYGK